MIIEIQILTRKGDFPNIFGDQFLDKNIRNAENAADAKLRVFGKV